MNNNFFKFNYMFILSGARLESGSLEFAVEGKAESQPHERCVDFQLGLSISTNIVGNINTAKLLQKGRKQFVSRRKRSPPLNPGSCLGYIYI